LSQKSGPHGTAEANVRETRLQTRKQYSAEEKIRIVLEGLRGEYSIAELCLREGNAERLYYKRSKGFLEAGEKRLSGDTALLAGVKCQDAIPDVHHDRHANLPNDRRRFRTAFNNRMSLFSKRKA
jgi:transposase-like protein